MSLYLSVNCILNQHQFVLKTDGYQEKTPMFQQQMRPHIRGKLGGTLARKSRRATGSIPNTPLVRVFYRGPNAAAG